MIANTKENLNAPSAGDTTSRLFDNIHLKRSDKEKISQKALSVSRRLSSAKSHQCSSKRCESRSNGRSAEPKPNDLNKQYRKLLMIKQHIFNNDLNVLQLSQQQPQHYEAAENKQITLLRNQRLNDAGNQVNMSQSNFTSLNTNKEPVSPISSLNGGI
jgi:hypothetical protein